MADNEFARGFDALQQFLSDSPKKMKQELRLGLYAGAQLVEARAKANCPVAPPNSENEQLHNTYYGALRDSIHVVMREKGNRITAVISAGGVTAQGADVWYAHLIEFTGAAPHIIKGKNGGPVTFNGHTYPVIHHPGMQAHPFLRPALDAEELAVIGLADKAVEAALK